MLNKVILVGRLAHDPEFQVSNGLHIAKIVIASTDRANKTHFIRSKCFGVLADQVYKYCIKGMTVACEARLEVYDNKIEVISDNIQFITHGKGKTENED